MSIFPSPGSGAITALGRIGQAVYGTDGQFAVPAVNRQGAFITQDQILEWAIQGRMFHSQQGDAATLVSFAETAYDEDQPQWALRVPTGTTVIPTSLIVTLQDAAGPDTILTWSTTTNDIGNGTSTAGVATCLRTDSPFTAAAVPRSLYTGNATAATGLIEFAHWLDAFAQAAGSINRFEWNIRTAAMIPVLVGPATLQMHLHATSTAPGGFGEYSWVEFPTPYLK